MTHSVNGNIVADRRFKGYDKNLVNLLVMNFMINKYGSYSAEYNMDFAETKYTKNVRYGQPSQLFIHIMDRPIPFVDCKPDFKDSHGDILLLIEVQSGSHVAISDVKDSSEIYNSTQSIYKLLKRRLPKSEGLEFLFDDEKRLYLPSDFRRLIKKAA